MPRRPSWSRSKARARLNKPDLKVTPPDTRDRSKWRHIIKHGATRCRAPLDSVPAEVNINDICLACLSDVYREFYGNE